MTSYHPSPYGQMTDNERTVQARRNPSPDPLANIYLQHMDLLYRMFNVNLVKCSPVENNTVNILVPVDALYGYIYYPLTVLPFIWSNNRDNIIMKVTLVK